MFASNEFLDSTIRFDNGTVIALIHTEYPGDRYPNGCSKQHDTVGEDNRHDTLFTVDEQRRQRRRRRRRRRLSSSSSISLTYPTCWTVTIGLGISYDWGDTWDHVLEPPNHLLASVPYTYNKSHLACGWGDPSNIVQNPNDGY
jgi:hypothetical protein